MTLYNPKLVHTFESGYRLSNGDDLNNTIGQALSLFTAVAAATAQPGGGQALATPVTASLFRVATVATAGDSIGLPPAAPGLQPIITNASAVALDVYAAAGADTINGAANATAYVIAAGKTAQFFAFGPGLWHALLSA